MSGYMTVAHNLLAMNGNRQLGITNKSKQKSTEKLSSGYRINRAADDAAGLSISEKMRNQIRGLNQGTKNAEDGISLCQVADGALAEVSAMLQRITELSVKSANDTNNEEDRQAIQDEIQEILGEIDEVSDKTRINGRKIFQNNYENENEIDLTQFDLAKESLTNGTFKLVDSDVEVVVRGGYARPMERNYANEFIRACSVYVTLREMPIPESLSNGYNSWLWSPTDGLFHGLGEEDYDELVELAHPYLVEKSSLVLSNINLLYEDSDCRSNQFRNKMNEAAVKFKNGDWRGAHNLYLEAFNMEEPNYQQPGWTNLYHLTSVISRAMTDLTFGLSGIASNSESIKSILEDTFQNLGGVIGNYLDRSGLGDSVNGQYLGGVIGGYRYPGEDVEESVIRAYMSFVGTEESSIGEERTEDRELWIQSGANAGEGLYLKLGNMDTEILGINGLNASTRYGAEDALDRTKEAIKKVNAIRSEIGAQQNRLEYTVNANKNYSENLQKAESLIRDTDMADEVVKLSKDTILQQVGEAMLAQSNQSQQGILSVLK